MKRVILFAVLLFSTAFLAYAASRPLYRIDLRNGASVLSVDRPFHRGTIVLFHNYPKRVLTGLPEESVVAVTPKARAAADEMTVVAPTVLQPGEVVFLPPLAGDGGAAAAAAPAPSGDPCDSGRGLRSQEPRVRILRATSHRPAVSGLSYGRRRSGRRRPRDLRASAHGGVSVRLEWFPGHAENSGADDRTGRTARFGSGRRSRLDCSRDWPQRNSGHGSHRRAGFDAAGGRRQRNSGSRSAGDAGSRSCARGP
jgi:hypothetical protein